MLRAGALLRYRETMLGHDSQERYYELSQGMLRCFVSERNRTLRCEIPLTFGERRWWCWWW